MTDAAPSILDDLLSRVQRMSPADKAELCRAKAHDDFINATAPGFRLTDRQKLADEMLESDARHVMLYGGSRCVAGDTVLDGQDKTIAELATEGLPVEVLTSHGRQMAEPPFRKGKCALLYFETLNGLKVSVTPDHRFWDGSCWVKAQELYVGSLVAVQSSETYPPASNLEYDPLASRASDRRLTNKLRDYRGGCYEYHHLYDEQLRLWSNRGQACRASRYGGLAHILGGLLLEGRELGSRAARFVRRALRDIHFGLWYARQSTTDACLATGHDERSAFHAFAQTCGLFHRQRESVDLVHSRACLRISSKLGGGSFYDQFDRLSCAASDVPYEGGYSLSRITRITRAPIQDYYTLHVPGSEQYFANGFLHHNSGKTFLILRSIVKRALITKSRHVVLRYRFNHVKNSVVHDTLPKVMSLCFPNLAPLCKLDKSDWYYKLPSGSEIWFGGLDDKERTEKILGQEFSTIFMNECSQIPWASRNMAMTRLAQKTSLRLKAFYDCNPPNEGHWTYKLFVAKKHPDQKGRLADPANYNALTVNPKDNLANLQKGYLDELNNLPARMRQRFLLGQFGSAAESALWTPELIDQCRYAHGELPQMRRVIIAVDPSGCSGPEDTRSDEIGIIVCGLGTDGKGYVLEDLSGRHGPAEWGKIVAETYERHAADSVIAETNFGGAMVVEVIRAANANIPVRTVTASRGKAVRAEPVATLFEQMKVMIAGSYPELEEQLCVVGGTLIETARGQIPIEKVAVGDRVMTRVGLAPVKQVGSTGISSSLMRLCTPETTLEVTPCHPIFSQGRFVSARLVKISDRLCVSRNWVNTASRSRGAAAGIIECGADTFGTQGASFFIAQSLRRTWGRLRAGGTSIIETVIRATIGSKIWSALALRSTTDGILLAAGTHKPIASLAWPLPRRVGQSANRENTHALSAGRAGPQFSPDSNYTVQSSVSAVRVIGAARPVYNLEVEPGYPPEYFANGILVHNCGMTTAGYVGERSPDRADAMIWGLASMFPAMTRNEEMLRINPANLPKVVMGHSNVRRRH